MNFSFSTAPIVEAQIAYRQEQIAHDFAVSHGWELSVRRLFGRRRRRPDSKPLAPARDLRLANQDRLGWR